MGEIRALSQDECGRLLKVVETNRSPFRKLRDRAIVVTFLLTGARLREILQLDKGDIDLHQSTIRLHRKGRDVNVLPLAQGVWSYAVRLDSGFLQISLHEIPNRPARDPVIPACVVLKLVAFALVMLWLECIVGASSVEVIFRHSASRRSA